MKLLSTPISEPFSCVNFQSPVGLNREPIDRPSCKVVLEVDGAKREVMEDLQDIFTDFVEDKMWERGIKAKAKVRFL